MPFSGGSGADDAFDYLFKIILIGDSNVGKTCVVHRFKTGQFSEKQQNTIGVDFTVRSLDLDGKRVKVGGRSRGGTGASANPAPQGISGKQSPNGGMSPVLTFSLGYHLERFPAVPGVSSLKAASGSEGGDFPSSRDVGAGSEAARMENPLVPKGFTLVCA